MTLPDRWENNTSANFDPDAHMPHSRDRVLNAFNQNSPAAHLWAALLYGVYHDRPDLSSNSIEYLPTFLACVQAFADKANSVFLRGRHNRALLTQDLIWRFRIPDNAVVTVNVTATP